MMTRRPFASFVSVNLIVGAVCAGSVVASAATMVTVAANRTWTFIGYLPRQERRSYHRREMSAGLTMSPVSSHDSSQEPGDARSSRYSPYFSASHGMPSSLGG